MPIGAEKVADSTENMPIGAEKGLRHDPEVNEDMGNAFERIQHETAIRVASNLIRNGKLSLEEIAEACELPLGEIVELANAQPVASGNEVDHELVKALDRAIDDLEAGREYSVDEGMDKVREIRARRRDANNKSFGLQGENGTVSTVHYVKPNMTAMPVNVGRKVINEIMNSKPVDQQAIHARNEVMRNAIRAERKQEADFR